MSDKARRRLAEEHGPGVFPEAFTKEGVLKEGWPKGAVADQRMTNDHKELAEHTRLLIELNEPEALLESLKRVCQAKVDSFAEGSIPPEEAARWRTAASALSEAMTTITASQEPHGAPKEPDKPIAQPGPVPTEGQAASAPD
jgi:hypothetical protein